MNKIIPIQKETPAPAEAMPELDDKHLKVMQAIMPYARSTPQKNLTEVIINKVTRKSKILFMLLPEWAFNFPPYNLARLLSVVKEAGYAGDAVDLNVKAWRDHKNWDIDFDPWHGSKEWRWMGDSYHTHLHEHMLPLLEKYLKYIQDGGFTVVSFSLYYCNQEPTDWMAREIKRRMPHITVMVGGPQCHAFPPGNDKPYYDYVVTGEGEEIILKILEEVENNGVPAQQNIIRQMDGQRLDLDKLPWADYSHFDLSEYRMPNGVNAEFSRGCTAKCVFCSETHFWKYRGRSAGGILEEVISLNHNYGIDYIWFLDSLVNGNLKELRAFCKGIIASGIRIKWTGYARCDERMDAEYYDDLAASGCQMLSYGIESGSNAVLEAMDKRVTVNEIEQNLKDGERVGVGAHSNWIIGFPTEKPQHFYESMSLIWRNRGGLDVVACGHGFTEPPDTIISQNSEKYGMIKAYYMNNWITGDYSNSKVHRLIRLITFNIMLKNTPGKFETLPSGQTRQIELANFDTSKYHTVTFDNPELYQNIEYDEFDFNIIKPGINPLADSVVNEIWPVLRLLWRTRGAYTIQIRITPEMAMNEFGDRLGCNFNAIYDLRVEADGAWTADFKFDFKQDANAWRYQDYSKETSMSAMRARQLALPDSKGEIAADWQEKLHKDLKYVEELQKLDLSFVCNYNGQGNF